MTDNASNYVRPEIWAIHVADAGRRDQAMRDELEAAVQAGADRDALTEALGQRMASPYGAQWKPAPVVENPLAGNYRALIDGIVRLMDEARAKKDWTKADSLRKTLTDAGVHVKNSENGSTWHF